MYGHDIAVFLRVIYKWLWLIALLLATVCITMFIIAMRAEPMYRATVTIQITAPPPQEVPLFSTVIGKQSANKLTARATTLHSSWKRTMWFTAS